MDTHRFATPLEGEPESLSRQVPIRFRGTSLDGTSVPSSSLLEHRTSLKDINGAGTLQLKLSLRGKEGGEIERETEL